MARDLMAKYDVPVPRYTSYPTVPQWHRTPVATEWLDSIARVTATPGASLALYVHVPFCESLCTFCGCNTVITRDHGREDPYIDLVLAELDRYLASVPSLASLGLRQLHLGGGTPTFLHPTALARLIDGLIERFPVQLADLERGIEVDPRVTSRDHLDILARRGFGRISLGVQDVDRDVQQLVNRIQPLELTAELTRAARELDYASVNFDLIYGLPGQTRASMARLASEVVGLRPDRLAVYSFATTTCRSATTSVRSTRSSATRSLRPATSRSGLITLRFRMTRSRTRRLPGHFTGTSWAIRMSTRRRFWDLG
jgi:oxygen-independent coproporphyrinogen-3 oxidase